MKYKNEQFELAPIGKLIVKVKLNKYDYYPNDIFKQISIGFYTIDIEGNKKFLVLDSINMNTEYFKFKKDEKWALFPELNKISEKPIPIGKEVFIFTKVTDGNLCKINIFKEAFYEDQEIHPDVIGWLPTEYFEVEE